MPDGFEPPNNPFSFLFPFWNQQDNEVGTEVQTVNAGDILNQIQSNYTYRNTLDSIIQNLQYAKRSEIPNIDLSSYLTVQDLAGYLSEYAKLTDIPNIDLSSYLTVQDLAGYLSEYAKLTDIPNSYSIMFNLQSDQNGKSILDFIIGSLGYAKKSDIPNVEDILIQIDTTAEYKNILNSIVSSMGYVKSGELSGLIINDYSLLDSLKSPLGINDLDASIKGMKLDIGKYPVVIGESSDILSVRISKMNSDIASLVSKYSTLIDPFSLSAYLGLSSIAGITAFTYGGKTVKEWIDAIGLNETGINTVSEGISEIQKYLSSLKGDMTYEGKEYTFNSDLKDVVYSLGFSNQSDIDNMRDSLLTSFIPSAIKNDSSVIYSSLYDTAINRFKLALSSDIPTDSYIKGLIDSNTYGFFGKTITETTDSFWGIYDNIKSLSDNSNMLLKFISPEPQNVDETSLAKYVSPFGDAVNTIEEYWSAIDSHRITIEDSTVLKLPKNLFTVVEHWYDFDPATASYKPKEFRWDHNIYASDSPMTIQEWDDWIKTQLNYSNPDYPPVRVSIWISNDDESLESMTVGKFKDILRFFGVPDDDIGKIVGNMMDIQTYNGLSLPPLGQIYADERKVPDITDFSSPSVSVYNATTQQILDIVNNGNESPAPSDITSVSDLGYWLRPELSLADSQKTNGIINPFPLWGPEKISSWITENYSPMIMAIDGKKFGINEMTYEDVVNYSVQQLNDVLGYNGNGFAPRLNIIDFLTGPGGITTIYGINDRVNGAFDEINSIKATLQNLQTEVDYAIDPLELQQALNETLSSYASVSSLSSLKNDIYSTMGFDSNAREYINSSMFGVVYEGVKNKLSDENDPITQSIMGLVDNVGKDRIGTWLNSIKANDISFTLPDMTFTDLLEQILTDISNMSGTDSNVVSDLLKNLNISEINNNLPNIPVFDFVGGIYGNLGWLNSSIDSIGSAFNPVVSTFNDIKAELNDKFLSLANLNNTLKGTSQYYNIGLTEDSNIAWLGIDDAELNTIKTNIESVYSYGISASNHLGDLFTEIKSITYNAGFSTYSGTVYDTARNLTNASLPFGTYDFAVLKVMFDFIHDDMLPALEYLHSYMIYSVVVFDKMKSMLDSMMGPNRPDEVIKNISDNLREIGNALNTIPIMDIPSNSDFVPGINPGSINPDIPDFPTLPSGFSP